VSHIETDYLVVGAGASGMAFTDALITETDVDVVLVDRRHAPGGHWLDAYPFVRLHQPSAFYGVNSMKLGHDQIDEDGYNAGYYERATAPEICAYYERVLAERLVPSGQVRFFGMSSYVGSGSGEHSVVSLLTGETTTVRVRRALVDATYLQGDIPATHTPSFTVDADVRLVTPNDLVASRGAASRYVVLGSGKTGMDTCIWLLDNGVPPDLIRWIKPRELWGLNRAGMQPLDQVASIIDGAADDLESAAKAENVSDLFDRLEACERLIRVDEQVQPTAFRGATLSWAEVEVLRSIEDVVRLGRVHRIASNEVVMEEGSIPSEPGCLYIDCTAAGLPVVPARPIFEPGRITVQTVRFGLTPFNAALVGHVEGSRTQIEEKNRLCPPNIYPNHALDWMTVTHTSTSADVIWSGDPEMSEWLERSRLNLAAGLRRHLGDPRMLAAIGRLLEHRGPALENLQRLMDDAEVRS
jgi:hypothetical protein